jgi:hypothetical protein
MMDGCDGSRHRAISFPSTRLGKDYAFIWLRFNNRTSLEFMHTNKQLPNTLLEDTTNLELDYATKCFEFKDLKVKGTLISKIYSILCISF